MVTASPESMRQIKSEINVNHLTITPPSGVHRNRSNRGLDSRARAKEWTPAFSGVTFRRFLQEVDAR